jgi:hypothetical protein
LDSIGSGSGSSDSFFFRRKRKQPAAFSALPYNFSSPCFIISSPRTLLLFITSSPRGSSFVSFNLVHAVSPTLFFVIFFISP